jgi:hypothetical protein
MIQYPNWIANSTNTVGKHRNNPNVVVRIRPNMSFPNWHVKYLIYHSHRAKNNTAIMQEPEGAMSMKSARGRAEKHIRHWQTSQNWSKDKDYGRLGRRAT